MIVNKSPVTFELKTTMPWHPPQRLEDPKDNSKEHHTWILCSAYLEIGSNDEVKEIKQRTHHALESERQLENFIDTTSQEIRNPLSVVMPCADNIITSYSAFTKLHPEFSAPIQTC